MQRMYQQEIKFFWPLTEQIPLDLDYSNCEKPKLTVIPNDWSIIGLNGNTTFSNRLIVDNIDVVESIKKLEQRVNTPWYKRIFK